MRVFLFLAVAGLLIAQAPGPVSTIQIVAEEDQILVGNNMDLRAIVRDAQGRTRTGDAVSWTVDNRAIAEIGQINGNLRAVGLGVVLVRATVGGITAEAPIQTMPREVQISPRSGQVAVGQDLQFRATALDVNGQPITNATFTWSVANRNAGGTSLATVTANGMVRGVFEGGITVRATYNYNRGVTGMQRQILVSAPVDVFVPRTYELRRLYNNGQSRIRNAELRARNSMVWNTDDGQLFFNASFGGLANGLVNVTGDQWRMVSAGGTTRFTGGSFATDVRIHSITRNGKMLTLEATNGAGLQVNRGDRDGVIPFLANGAPLAGTENGNNFFLTRNSYTESGWVLVRASYRVPGTNINGVGLFRGFGERITELVASNLDTFPGLTPAPGTLPSIDNDFGITEDGVCYFTVSAGANRILYRYKLDREKILAVNDAFEGSTVRSFNGGGGNRPAFFVADSGDLLYSVTLNNNFIFMVRHPGDGRNRPQTLRMNSQSGFLWHDPTGGTLVYGNPLNSRGNGVHHWKTDNTNRPVAVFGQTPVFGQQIQDCESGHINQWGEIVMMMRLTGSNMVIARAVEGVAEPWVQVQHGDRPNIELTANLLNFIGGARTGPPHFMAGGESGSIAVLNGSDLSAPVAIGERLFGTNMWFGGSVNNSNWNMRKSPTGDVYWTNSLGLGRVRAGSTNQELFLRFPITRGTVTLNAPFWVDANSNGDVFWTSSTNLGDNRLYITNAQGDHREILVYSTATTTASVLDGNTVLAVDSYTIADDARMMANVRFRNDPNATVYLYDGVSRWQFLARANETVIAGKLITGIANIFRAAGNRFFAQFSIAGGNQILCEYANNQWRLVLDNNERMIHGTVMNSVNMYDVNRQGDLAFVHSIGIPYLMVRRANGNQEVVMNQFRRTPDGDYIIRILNIDFRDDRTIYFLGVNSDDEQVVYMARPLN